MYRWLASIAVMAVVALVSLPAHASPASDPNLFSGIRANVQLTTMLYKMQVTSGSLDQAQQTAIDGRQFLDQSLKQVMAEVNANSDALKAFKHFYLAAQDFYADVDADTPLIVAKAELTKRQEALNSAANAMMLEAKLAGYATD